MSLGVPSFENGDRGLGMSSHRENFVILQSVFRRNNSHDKNYELWNEIKNGEDISYVSILRPLKDNLVPKITMPRASPTLTRKKKIKFPHSL